MARGNKWRQGRMSTTNCSAKPLVRRNRASPARIVKLYKFMSEQQKNMIHKAGFGGLLQIACATIPGELATWLLVDCFDAEACELVFPGRGKIAVTAESVSTIMGLPIGGDVVKYELDADAINYINEKYGISTGTAPKIQSVIKRLKDNKAANEDFLRTWLMLAVSTFLCPPTSLGISPRCYPPLLDLSRVSKLNWSQFVVDHIKNAALKMDRKNSVKGCLLFLAILYADSLNVEHVQIPETKPRIGAWNRKLLDKVIKSDTNRDGSFGKLRLKESGHSAVQNSLVQMDDIKKFVSYKKKRKLCEAISKVCGGITELLGTFVKEVSEIQDPPEPCLRRSKRNTPAEEDEDELLEVDSEEDSDYEDDGEAGSGNDDSEDLEPCLRRSKPNTPAEEDEDELLEVDREEDSDYEDDGAAESGDGDSEDLELEDLKPCSRRSKRNTLSEEDEQEPLDVDREEDSDYEDDGAAESGDDDSKDLELEDEDVDVDESGDNNHPDWHPPESEAIGHDTENANSNGAKNDINASGDMPGRQEDVPRRQDDEDEDFVHLLGG